MKVEGGQGGGGGRAGAIGTDIERVVIRSLAGYYAVVRY